MNKCYNCGAPADGFGGQCSFCTRERKAAAEHRAMMEAERKRDAWQRETERRRMEDLTWDIPHRSTGGGGSDAAAGGLLVLFMLADEFGWRPIAIGAGIIMGIGGMLCCGFPGCG